MHVKTRYARWMQSARKDSQTKPGFVLDPRASVESPRRKDAISVYTGAPRAAQPYEIHVHVSARSIQRTYRRYFVALTRWAATVMQCMWRSWDARMVLRKAQAERARQDACIARIRLLRIRRRVLAWREAASRARKMREIGARFFHSGCKVLKTKSFDALFDIFLDARERNEHTLRMYCKFKTHRRRVRALYTWADWAVLQRQLRNFVKHRLFRRWRAHARAIVSARVFGIETRAACTIQKAYRAMRERDRQVMEEMQCQTDVVTFKKRRQAAALFIQCRMRIYLAHRALDARHCVKYALVDSHQGVIGMTLRGCAMVNHRRQLAWQARQEAIRYEDERCFVESRMREARNELPTFRARWWRRRSWATTREGRAATRAARAFRSTQTAARARGVGAFFIDASGVGSGALSLAGKLPPLPALKFYVEAERDRQMEATLTRRFRARWPPAFACPGCGRPFSSRAVGERHVCPSVSNKL